MCMGALFTLLLQVKKCSEKKSSFCIVSTRLGFAVSEVAITAIVWFIITRDPVQYDKHVEL